jgi:hypothetical protein
MSEVPEGCVRIRAAVAVTPKGWEVIGSKRVKDAKVVNEVAGMAGGPHQLHWIEVSVPAYRPHVAETVEGVVVKGGEE